MRVYATKYNPEQLFHNIKSFEQFYNGCSTKTDFYSDEGVFTIENSTLYKINIEDVKTKKYNFNDTFELIVDESRETKTEVSQMPIDHTTIELTSFFYKINPKSTIQMVVIGVKHLPMQPKNKYEGFVPYDYYFDGIDEDISVFLSQFN